MDIARDCGNEVWPSVPDIVFLGFAERAILTREGFTNILKWNVIGLKNILLFNFFPVALTGLHFAVAIRVSASAIELPPLGLELSMRDQSGREVGKINIRFNTEIGDGPLTHSGEGPILHQLGGAWTLAFLPMPQAITISEPGLYSVTLMVGAEKEIRLGEFACFLAEPAPLTAERIAAIKSNPHATKAVRVIYGCNFCTSKLRVYAGLDKIANCETEGFVWYTQLSDRFQCECGKTNIDLSSMRRNLFALIGQTPVRTSDANFLPMYESSALEGLRVEFLALLDRHTKEEEIQSFIEQNPILLHQFPADKLFCKPHILTRFVADFAILTPQKELVFIEIERASMRLLKKDGGQTAQLTHALDQVKSWLHDVREHWLTVLETLNIPRDAVSHARGIVIAGRDAGNDVAHIRRLKATLGDHLSLFTYDDLAAGMAVLAREMSQF